MHGFSGTIFRWNRVAVAGLVASGSLILAKPGWALPSFARQTGQECAACHNGFPELTAYGRLFKANGFTFSAEPDHLFGNSDLPPISAMVVGSYTHTEAGQTGGAGPHFAPNNNPMIQQAAVFYGGAILPHLGALVQVNYEDSQKRISWDDLDIRYSGVTSLLGSEAVFGVSFNNNPTVTDLWNSTPAWGYPDKSSSIVPQAGATLIEGAMGSQVVGLNPYLYWNRLVYAEFGLYRTLAPRMDTTLGADPSLSSIKGVSPYWRLAVEPKWGRNSWELGTFGMAATLNPNRVTGFGTDHTTDIGFDTQYQFSGARDSITLQASWITENQNLTASQATGSTTNGHNHFRSLHAQASYYYEKTFGGTVQYFRVDGSGDNAAYATDASGAPISANASPNTGGWVFELNYIPFSYGGPSFWPWLNMKLGAQYVRYNQFNGGTVSYDGAGRNASDNNTLYLYSMLLF